MGARVQMHGSMPRDACTHPQICTNKKNVFTGLWSDPSDHPANAQWLRENVAFSRNGRGGDGWSARAYGGTWSR